MNLLCRNHVALKTIQMNMPESHVTIQANSINTLKEQIEPL